MLTPVAISTGTHRLRSNAAPPKYPSAEENRAHSTAAAESNGRNRVFHGISSVPAT